MHISYHSLSITYTFLCLVICLYRILDLFYIISCIMFFASFLYFHVPFLSCSYTMHVLYTFISHILSYNLSYTVTCNIIYLVNSYLHVLYQTIISYDIYLYISIHMHISIHIHITFITYHLYIRIACQSFSLHVLCLWHISYLYFYCIPVSILCIFHIHSMTYCFPCSITYSFIYFCIFIYFLYFSCPLILYFLFL